MKGHTEPILIAGAGVGGLTAALALGWHGIPAIVFERRGEEEVLAAAGFGHTIWSNATSSLARFGLGDALRAVGDPLIASENRNSRQEIVFRMEIARSLTPGAMPALGIGRADLIRLLRKTCLEQGVEIRYGTRSRPVPAGGRRRARLGRARARAHGHRLRPDRLRPDRRRRDPLHRAHATARRRAAGGHRPVDLPGIAPGTCGLRSGVVHLFANPATGIGGGAWLIGGDRVVWTVSCERPAEGEDPQGSWARAMELAEVLGEIPRTFVSRTPPDTATRTHLYYHDWLESWDSGAVTMLGDATHALPTDLGQSACQAIEDGVVLADALAAAPDVVSGLRAYEARRKPRVKWVRQQVMRVHGSKPIRNPAARWAVTRIAKVVVAMSAPKMWPELQRPPELAARAQPQPSTARTVR